MSATGLLTPLMIGSYHEMFTYLANKDKALNMLLGLPQISTCDYFSLHSL